MEGSGGVGIGVGVGVGAIGELTSGLKGCSGADCGTPSPAGRRCAELTTLAPLFFFPHFCIQMQQSWTKRKTKEQHSGGRREQSCQTDIPEACAWRRKLQAQVVPSVVQCHLEYEVTLLKGEAKHTRPVYQMKIG